MCKRNQKILEDKLNILELGINKISKNLENKEKHDLIYILGSKKRDYKEKYYCRNF